MGQRRSAHCRECGNDFLVNDGGGLGFVQLRCADCGRARNLEREVMDNLAAQRGIHPSAAGNSLDADFQKLLGRCDCGGEFTSDAAIRCPNCRSTEVTLGKPDLLYD